MWSRSYRLPRSMCSITSSGSVPRSSTAPRTVVMHGWRRCTTSRISAAKSARRAASWRRSANDKRPEPEVTAAVAAAAAATGAAPAGMGTATCCATLPLPDTRPSCITDAALLSRPAAAVLLRLWREVLFRTGS